MHNVSGEFIDRAGERFYVIHNVDAMEPFLVSVISNVDHWLFVSSAGGLTAGRVSPDFPLFPYITDDKIHDAGLHTGGRTVIRSRGNCWEPFNPQQDRAFRITRNLYKSVLGNKLTFEEINHDLGLTFRNTWLTSDTHGFVRECELEGVTEPVEILDGIQNILPAGTPSFTQTNSSNLVDAYKWNEYHASTGLALYTLASGITDRAEPSESLRATTVYQLGLDAPRVLLSSTQLKPFCAGESVTGEELVRGKRGAFFVQCTLESSTRWRIVADVERSQAEVVKLSSELRDRAALDATLSQSIARGSDGLSRIMAASDGFQVTAEETVSVHHYANVVFNVLRGGILHHHYIVSSEDLRRTVRAFNAPVFERNKEFLEALPEELAYGEIQERLEGAGDSQLRRLVLEYLPITFGRRHGDPSRPWNKFEIKLTDERGDALLSYQGNWRDIFQNWEALAWSYPEIIENMIAKFVNASTLDGYNPYRITKEGIDWEVEDPEDPWSYIGYWGDHQIIYLLKLLEFSKQFHPDRLGALLLEPLFAYANVPYRIKTYEALLDDPKNTVTFDEAVAEDIERRVDAIGADGKLVFDADGAVYQVNLLEKLLVPVLAKLGNLVPTGGIWMNTQRPEWNDANNALVGQGLSMVTLYYLRRYLLFLDTVLPSRAVELSIEVDRWLMDTVGALAQLKSKLGEGPLSQRQILSALAAVGQAASRYREVIYRQGRPSGKRERAIDDIKSLVADGCSVIEHSITVNRRDDGLYHAYNTLAVEDGKAEVGGLSLMLEGQVAALSSGALSPAEAVEAVEALYASDVFRADQHSFMLYPDRDLPSFLDKNRVASAAAESIPIVPAMLAAGDDRVLVKDAENQLRFNPSFTNVQDLHAALDELAVEYDIKESRPLLAELYENTFRHREFTGRSGTMFGFEGLGSIYWHMVSKLLLAVQENYFDALDQGAPESKQLAALYYRVREGIGFNKTPEEYGAFPTDPYSHTPKHSGARQPGMTGQVKEEILTRFGELGLRLNGGAVKIQPSLLRAQEFVNGSRVFCYLAADDQWRDLDVPDNALAFTWCQVPFVYSRGGDASVVVKTRDGGERKHDELLLDRGTAAEIFGRTGEVVRVDVSLPPGALLDA
ncbi:MAG: hypothetical protein AAF654_06945 [Myxococcota bacterium]